MKIHHYTSIETLALILKYKTIRFNRLDRVDDMEESMYGSGPTKIKLGQYVFVSCWTKDDLENISLWKMYKRQLASRSAARELNQIPHFENLHFVPVFLFGMTGVIHYQVPVDWFVSMIRYFITTGTEGFARLPHKE